MYLDSKGYAPERAGQPTVRDVIRLFYFDGFTPIVFFTWCQTRDFERNVIIYENLNYVTSFVS